MFKFHKFLSQNKLPALLGLFLFIIFMGFLASRITLKADIINLIPSGERQEVISKVLDKAEFNDKIIVSISSLTEIPHPEELTIYARQFLDSVNNQLPKYIDNIQGEVPEEGLREIYNFVYQNLPLYLIESDYNILESRLNRDSIRERMATNYKNLISPTGLVTKVFLFKDPLALTNIGLSKLEELKVDDDFELYNNFLITKDHRHVLLFITPAIPASEIKENQIFIHELERIQQELNKKFEGVRGEFFGEVLYSITNARQIQSDLKLTLVMSGIFLLGFLILYYKSVYISLLIFIPGITGGLTSLAVIYLIKGSISSISLGIGAVLLGISLDYSLHILTYYKNNQNLKLLYQEVIYPVIMSSVTTAIAFLCLLFLKSEILNDLGLFAAISVGIASLVTLILIPLLYQIPKWKEAKTTMIEKLAFTDLHRKLPWIISLFVFFIIALTFFSNVKYNDDPLALNYEPEEIRDREEYVKNRAGNSSNSVYLISYGNTVDEALGYNNQLYGKLGSLEESGMIQSYSSIGGVVLSTSTQVERIERWKEFWTPQKIAQVENDLIELSSTYGFMPHSFQNFYNLLQEDFEPLYLEDYRETTTLYLEDFITSGNSFATVTTSLQVDPGFKDQLLQSLDNIENVEVIDREQLNKNFTEDLKNEFNRLIGYSIIAIFLILLLFYRSIELTMLTLIPVGVTWVITLGLLNLFNVEFNILNIIITTFIFGLGLDYSIYITQAFLSEYSTGNRTLKIYRTSILLSVITTLLGTGALFFALHPALISISIVSFTAVVISLLVTFILQGFIFQHLFINRKSKGKKPYSFKGWINPSKYMGGDELYHRGMVYDNYRYKKDLPEIKRKFDREREKFLKVSDFIEKDDKILHYPSGKGLLGVFLHYKLKEVEIWGIETNPEKLKISINTLAATAENLHFSDNWPENAHFYNTFIISEVPGYDIEEKMRTLITSSANKVIILDPEYSYRWIIDLNFEIKYRQNAMVLLQRVD